MTPEEREIKAQRREETQAMLVAGKTTREIIDTYPQLFKSYAAARQFISRARRAMGLPLKRLGIPQADRAASAAENRQKREETQAMLVAGKTTREIIDALPHHFPDYPAAKQFITRHRRRLQAPSRRPPRRPPRRPGADPPQAGTPTAPEPETVGIPIEIKRQLLAYGYGTHPDDVPLDETPATIYGKTIHTDPDSGIKFIRQGLDRQIITLTNPPRLYIKSWATFRPQTKQ